MTLSFLMSSSTTYSRSSLYYLLAFCIFHFQLHHSPKYTFLIHKLDLQVQCKNRDGSQDLWFSLKLIDLFWYTNYASVHDLNSRIFKEYNYNNFILIFTLSLITFSVLGRIDDPPLLEITFSFFPADLMFFYIILIKRN